MDRGREGRYGELVTAPPDRRQHARHAVRTHCVVETSSGECLAASRIVDLSRDGVFFEGNAIVHRGEQLEVVIRVPGGNSWMRASGEVTRVSRGRRARDTRGFGMRITAIDPASRRLLVSLLRRHPPANKTARSPLRA